MTDSIRSNLTNAYMMFVLDLADPSACNKEKLEADMQGLVPEIFDCQKNGDRAKRLLKDAFPKALALYFNSFNGADGLNYGRLDREMTKNRKHILRHLGKDKLSYLALIVHLMSAIDGKNKKGLLFAVGS